MTNANSRLSNIDEEDEDSDEIIAIELPRKITLFRAVIERKMGIDREHGDENLENSTYSSRRSIQTNHIVDQIYRVDISDNSLSEETSVFIEDNTTPKINIKGDHIRT
jgi:hypothetical protein